MADLVRFSHLIKPMCVYLQAALPAYSSEASLEGELFASNVLVGRAVPNPRRDRMVVFANRGGYQLNEVWSRSTVDAQVWAKTQSGADELAHLVTAILRGMNDGLVVSVDITTQPQDMSDASGQPERFIRSMVTHRALS